MSRKLSNRRRSIVEFLEDRQLLSQIFSVNTTQDFSERGTLRWAIEQVNLDETDTPGDPDRIIFKMGGNPPDSGIYTISLKSPLPAIVRPVIIDGSTQFGYTSSPVIQISGANLPAPGDGLSLAAGSDFSTIRALWISDFSQGNGIAIAGSGGNVIENNLLRNNPNGSGLEITGPGGNAVRGNQIEANSNGITVRGSNNTGNTIGGTTDATRNFISGNTADGINLDGAVGTVIDGNWIGFNPGGALSPNTRYGISLTSGATGNTIGGTTLDSLNVIAGSTAGVAVIGSNNNGILGNFIGTTIDGGSAAPNDVGVFVSGGSGNTIGGGNLISGNATVQVHLSGNITSSNTVAGNLIGTNLEGQRTIAVSGNTVGILIEDAPSNTVGPNNIIAGFTAGIYIAGANASGNQVIGNDIGTNAASAGTAGLGNTVGVYINGAPSNVVGGLNAARNVISGNSQAGVYIYGALATGNQVVGNIIGLAPDGASPFRSGTTFLQGTGVAINDASQNSIGGTAEGSGNVLTGNDSAGVYILGHGNSSTGNVVQNNLIGLNADGSQGVGNAQYGVLLYNASNNKVIRTGTTANLFGKNPSGDVRDYVGTESAAKFLAKLKSRAKLKAHVHKHRHRHVVR